jgi:hypothetical protein
MQGERRHCTPPCTGVPGGRSCCRAEPKTQNQSQPASQPPGRAGVTEQGKYTTEGDLGRGFGGLTSALSGEGGRKKRRPRRGEDRRRRNDLQWCTGCFSEGCLFIYRENGHRATAHGIGVTELLLARKSAMGL